MLIYKVSFPNGKVYIGKTCQKIERRKAQHYRSAQTNDGLIFHRALLKYNGQEHWNVIEEVENNVIAIEREIFHINKEKSNNINFGYNMTIGGDGRLSGQPLTKEWREKIRIAITGRKNSNLTKKTMSKSAFERWNKNPINLFDVFDNNGKLLGRWDNIRKCGEDLGVKTGGIGNCLSGIAKSHHGYTFKKIVQSNRKTISKENKKIKSERLREYWSKHPSFSFDVWDVSGAYKGRWNNQHRCAKDLSIKQGKINECLKRPDRYKSHKGYIFKKASNATTTTSTSTV